MKDWIRKPMVPLALCVALILPTAALASTATGSPEPASCLVLSSQPAQADAGSPGVTRQAHPLLVAANDKPSLWDQTKHNAAKAWHKTKHGAKRAWEGAKDLSSAAYHNAKKTVSKGVDTVEKKTSDKKSHDSKTKK